jgi:hypothetical protein
VVAPKKRYAAKAHNLTEEETVQLAKEVKRKKNTILNRNFERR